MGLYPAVQLVCWACPFHTRRDTVPFFIFVDSICPLDGFIRRHSTGTDIAEIRRTRFALVGVAECYTEGKQGR